ncbi:branched-chain amino acid transport system II carrier protein [Corynebacterium uropygiale]|uniref:Branched-chain amino acid transport system II carrier protein n=1 Tax=Corynebacterium uropygiale TaxID=1775911 RepID=A0A9X1U6Y0_9CORY|nr:branched-chain amino acid transport system II carrier protein [Corynebacterium uropygiale]MCF4006172.1 branched-chain amino acid transport system II carrier protein [Corynebacterium uropygiale]
MTSESQPRRAGFAIILFTSFTLFSMFFGAGNLIFPPMLGAQSGTSFLPAILGFLGTSVLLPVLAIIAIANSGSSVTDLARRAGPVFGLIFPILAYLSIGAFYALPRTGAVSFSTALQPITGWDSTLASALFNAVFFGIALFLAYNPTKLVDKLGKILTPALLVLLVVLVCCSMGMFHGTPGEPSEKFASAPAAVGLVEGYLTMDALAALAFGIVVISSLRMRGLKEGHQLVHGTIRAGLIAGVILAVIYLGLGYIGQIIDQPSQYADGAALLTDAARLTMGLPGQVVFGLIVLLACMTTAVGLIAATSEFFESLLPGVRYHAWAVIFAVMSWAMATMGLQTVLDIAAPVIGFLYPPAVTLIIISLIESLLPGSLRFRYAIYAPVWLAVVWSAMTSFNDLGWGSFWDAIIGWSPLTAQSLGWLLPVSVVFVIMLVVDIVLSRAHPRDPQDEAVASEHDQDAAVAH